MFTLKKQNATSQSQKSHTWNIELTNMVPPTEKHIEALRQLRDITATLLTEFCHSVGTEPVLQPVSGEFLKYKTENDADGHCCREYLVS